MHAMFTIKNNKKSSKKIKIKKKIFISTYLNLVPIDFINPSLCHQVQQVSELLHISYYILEDEFLLTHSH